MAKVKYKTIESANNSKRMAKVMFSAKEKGEWVDGGCDVCKGGMTKRIYDFQRENRESTICMTCDKKQRKN